MNLIKVIIKSNPEPINLIVSQKVTPIQVIINRFIEPIKVIVDHFPRKILGSLFIKARFQMTAVANIFHFKKWSDYPDTLKWSDLPDDMTMAEFIYNIIE